MSAPAFDPEWSDDLMAIADAVGVTSRPHPDLDTRFVPHPSHAEEFTNLTLELTVAAWAADQPIPLTPTEHVTCAACSETLCSCPVQCEDFQRDVCSHYGYPHCASCGPLNCADCGDEARRWER